MFQGGFSDDFFSGINLAQQESSLILSYSWIQTPLGRMLAIGDDERLYLLEFADHRLLERKIRLMGSLLNAHFLRGVTKPIASIDKELKAFFHEKARAFTTPLYLMGSSFQKSVWQELLKIPAGQTRSYRDIAIAVNKPKAYRAVGSANGVNHLCIIIPCHRVINANGLMGGYAGNISRKRWLLEYESKTFLR